MQIAIVSYCRCYDAYPGIFKRNTLARPDTGNAEPYLKLVQFSEGAAVGKMKLADYKNCKI